MTAHCTQCGRSMPQGFCDCRHQAASRHIPRPGYANCDIVQAYADWMARRDADQLAEVGAMIANDAATMDAGRIAL